MQNSVRLCSGRSEVESNTVLLMARYRCNISSKEAVLPRRNDGEMARYTLWHNSVSIIRFGLISDLDLLSPNRKNQNLSNLHQSSPVVVVGRLLPRPRTTMDGKSLSAYLNQIDMNFLEKTVQTMKKKVRKTKKKIIQVGICKSGK